MSPTSSFPKKKFFVVSAGSFFIWCTDETLKCIKGTFEESRVTLQGYIEFSKILMLYQECSIKLYSMA